MWNHVKWGFNIVSIYQNSQNMYFLKSIFILWEIVENTFHIWSLLSKAK